MSARVAAFALALAVTITSQARSQVRESMVDFSLEATSGRMRSMADVRGRVVVLFYEDREHTSDNDAFKHELHRYLTTHRLQQRVTTYAVANVSHVEGIMQNIARPIIRSIAESRGIELLLDWQGALQRPPLAFADRAANLAVVDREGVLRYRHIGRLDQAQKDAFYGVLRAVLAAPSRSR